MSEFVNEPRVKRGVVVALVVGVTLVVIAIIVITVLLIIRARKKKPSNNGGGGQTPPPSAVTCTQDTDCATGICDTLTSLCAECLQDEDCTGTLPKCLTTTKKCVSCLADGDCDDPKTCVQNTCCDGSAPVLGNMTYQATSNPTATINYSMAQNPNTSRLLLSITDPATNQALSAGFCLDYNPDDTSACVQDSDCGFKRACVTAQGATKCNLISCFSFDAGASVSINSQANQFPFYPGFNYRFTAKIAYKCGSSSTITTPFSNSVTLSVPVCNSVRKNNIQIYGIQDTAPGNNYAPTIIGVPNGTAASSVLCYWYITVDDSVDGPSPDAQFPIYVIGVVNAPMTPITFPTHPNQCPVVLPVSAIFVSTTGMTHLYYAYVPRPGPTGSRYVTQSFVLGVGSNCNGPLSPRANTLLN